MATPSVSNSAPIRVKPVTAPRLGSRRRRRLTTVLVYAGLLLAAVLAFVSHEFGATWHSIIGIAVIGIITWHVTSKRRWVKSAARKRLAHPERTLVVYNTVLATMFTIADLSGLAVLLWDAGGIVLQVHFVSGLAFVLMIFGHLGLNSRRLITKLRRRPTRATAG